MAIFHFTAKVISRGKGQSAIAAAAYRSGERLRDEQAGQQKFYTARAERIEYTAIMVPGDAPAWARERNSFWNEAERAELRKDAQLAREVEVALPHELTLDQQIKLTRDFAREAFVRKGYGVDIAIHAPDPKADERNWHAHLLVTRRTLGPDGFSAKKDWQFDKAQLQRWREQWAHLMNRHLERYGHEARVDHRSLKEQGVDREPGIHLGYAASGMEQRGARSERGDLLRDVESRNGMRAEMRAIDGELLELERPRGWGAAVDGLDWSHRGGMVQQQRSALEAIRQRGKGKGPPADLEREGSKDGIPRQRAARGPDKGRGKDDERERDR